MLSNEIIKSNDILVIHFPLDAKVIDVDKKIISSISTPENYNKTIILDFSNSRYIELASLVYIISLLTKRSRDNLETLIRLPKNKNVRDFMRSWNFPNATKEATGCYFKNIVTSDCHKYFGENPELVYQKYAGDTFFDRGTYLQLLKYYLPIATFYKSLQSFTSLLALDEANRWKGQVVTSILEKHLQGPQGYFSARIVFEAMMNAIRHPNANIIQTASHFESFPNNKITSSKKAKFLQSSLSTDPKKSKTGLFTIIWWDDGKSILDTLSDAIHKGENINLGTPPSLFTKYILQLEGTMGNKIGSPIQYDSTYIPDKESSKELLLLSAIFPGITCDVKGKKLITHPDLGKELPEKITDPLASSASYLTLPGMGLYLLVNTAVKIYKGEVAFRTKHFFMNIKNPPQKSDCDYSVKIRTYFDQIPFLGNMLTVRLPLV